MMKTMLSLLSDNTHPQNRREGKMPLFKGVPYFKSWPTSREALIQRGHNIFGIIQDIPQF